MKLIPKITSKTLSINVEMEIRKNSAGKDTAVAKDNAHNAVLYRVAGIATGFAVGESNYGEWVKFQGEFQAIKRDTGEVFHSGALFLPPMASNLLRGILQGATGATQFAFDIGVTGDAESAVGYQWTVTPLLKLDTESNPVSKLLASLEPMTALPAPDAGADILDAAEKETVEPTSAKGGKAKGK